MSTLIVDTLGGEKGREIAARIERMDQEVRVIHTEGKKILPCIGCNNCWLKTPGICSVQDDYAEILKAYLEYDNILYISGTALGFVDYKMKNVIDRVLPLVTMLIHTVNGQERHVGRYSKKYRFGLVYAGEADHAYLNRWLERVAVNFEGTSIGAFREEEIAEVKKCI